MRVTVRFLGHSGFTVSQGRRLLVFDAAMGREPRRDVRRAVRPTVFVSHAHRDHFDPRIYAWRRLHPAIRYVLSDGVPGPEDARRLSPGGLWSDDGLSVRAVPSTDEGVAFLVEFDGIRIFHAGDLNDWHWREQSAPAEADAAHRAFTDILDTLRGQAVDIAFFPVDPRMGAGYDEGARAFCRALRPAHFFPMHFARRFDVPADFRLWALDACPCVTVHDILREGQAFALDLK